MAEGHTSTVADQVKKAMQSQTKVDMKASMINTMLI